MATAFIALGSNLGNREKHLAEAVDQLRNLPDTKIITVSTWYETAPVGGPPQGLFLNGVVQLQTPLTPHPLFSHLQKIEQDLGRPAEHPRWEARVIDLDLLSYDNLVYQSPELIIPHPRLHERRFVLEPLAEIAPTWKHPQMGQSAAELLRELHHADHPSAG